MDPSPRIGRHNTPVEDDGHSMLLLCEVVTVLSIKRFYVLLSVVVQIHWWCCKNENDVEEDEENEMKKLQ